MKDAIQMPHPAYPSRLELQMESDAVTRDIAILMALKQLHIIVSDALERASHIELIDHPDQKWRIEDLRESLEGSLFDIEGEIERVRAHPVVIGEEF